ncbi:DMT family transporter [Ramlibacter rhizophilus]|uniref:DMT family transporter n=1 Tax=Ramlibacter rhizophilus TaxID=1781167 RepID=A0A4Z0BPU6_9BURK|nr:DMT family transporter [Ramlibacter rhizophilus]TFZ00009.1 DMT family transporter [Ramlibacter rhizophilus]
MPRNALADFLLLAAVWGSSFLFTRLTVVEFGPLGTAAMRCAIAAALLVPLVLLRGLGPQLRRHWKPGALIGLLNSGIPFALFAFAVQHVSTGLSAILNATVPMFGAVVAWAWLKDRPDAGRVLGLGLGFTGVALLAGQTASVGTGASGWAVLAALAACLCYGIAASAAKLYLGGIAPLVTAASSQIGATLALALPALWWAPQHLPSASAWAAMAALGLMCTGLAYVLYFRVIERAGPARAMTVTFLIPVFAVGYGVAFLGERVTTWMLACGAVIVLGTALSTGILGFSRRAAPAR